ncbi:MAG: hypothetical protein E7E89_06325 [Veillonella sp.]|nr:hypothetical protein [Veillonella sp.]
MNTESLRNEVLVPAVAKTLDIAAKAKPTKEEIITTAKITAAVTVATAVVSLAVQAVKGLFLVQVGCVFINS